MLLVHNEHSRIVDELTCTPLRVILVPGPPRLWEMEVTLGVVAASCAYLCWWLTLIIHDLQLQTFHHLWHNKWLICMHLHPCQHTPHTCHFCRMVAFRFFTSHMNFNIEYIAQYMSTRVHIIHLTTALNSTVLHLNCNVSCIGWITLCVLLSFFFAHVLVSINVWYYLRISCIYWHDSVDTTHTLVTCHF